MIGDIFSGIDANLIVYGLLFVIFFVIIQLALSRSLKDNNSSSIIAFCVSLLSIYGLYKTDFDVVEIFYGIGINENIIYNVIPFVILAGLVYLLWKVKFRFVTLFLGLALIGASFLVYEKTLVLVIGIAFVVFGIILMIRETRRRNRAVYLKHLR